MITLLDIPLSFCHMTPYMWCTVLIRVKPSPIPSSFLLWNKFKRFLKNCFFCSRCSSDESAEWSLKLKLKWTINQNPQLCCHAVREWKRSWARALFRMEFKHTAYDTVYTEYCLNWYDRRIQASFLNKFFFHPLLSKWLLRMWKRRKSNLVRFFLWRTKVLEAVCKCDWHNVRFNLWTNLDENFGLVQCAMTFIMHNSTS